MASKTINLLLVIVILAIISPEIVEAQNPIPEPMNRTIVTIRPRKCFLYMWDGLCTPNNCTVQIDAELTKENDAPMTIGPFIRQKPFTKDNKQALCFWDNTAVKNDGCCERITAPGGFLDTKPTAQRVEFSDYEKIAINITRTQYGVSKTWTDMMRVLPWKIGCILKPCDYGTCAPEGNSYKCTCDMGWEGTNCTVLTGWTRHMKKCLGEAPAPVKTIPLTNVTKCSKACEGMNDNMKHGCKSIQFDGERNKPAKCQLFDVNRSSDSKVLTSCNSTYFELNSLPRLLTTSTMTSTTSPSASPTTSSTTSLTTSPTMTFTMSPTASPTASLTTSPKTSSTTSLTTSPTITSTTSTTASPTVSLTTLPTASLTTTSMTSSTTSPMITSSSTTSPTTKKTAPCCQCCQCCTCGPAAGLVSSFVTVLSLVVLVFLYM